MLGENLHSPEQWLGTSGLETGSKDLIRTTENIKIRRLNNYYHTLNQMTKYYNTAE